MSIQQSFFPVQSAKTQAKAPVSATVSLHQQFVSLNFQIIGMRNKLMVLLLEIYQKEVYKEHKCADIFEYAFKFARISRERVQKALRTLKNTQDKPILRAQIATQGLNKVAMVAKLATPETEEFFAQHVESMRQPVLQAYVKQIRAGKPEVPKMSIELDEEMQIIFNQLKQKEEKKLKRELSNQAMLRIILKNEKDVSGDGIAKPAKSLASARIGKDVSADVPASMKISKNNNIATTKSASKSEKCPDATFPDTKTKDVLEDVQPKFVSRTISLPKQREIATKQNGKCAYPKCTKPIKNFHHTVPFAFARSHESVVGLCKIHHEFCHHGVVRYELDDPSKWRLGLEPHLSQFDALKLRYRKST